MGRGTDIAPQSFVLNSAIKNHRIEMAISSSAIKNYFLTTIMTLETGALRTRSNAEGEVARKG
jgi:hypothetical protein